MTRLQYRPDFPAMHPETIRVIAVSAIHERLNSPLQVTEPHPARCVLFIDRLDDGHVLMRVNSGGNSIAVQDALRGAGYRSEHIPDTQHGALVVVLSHDGRRLRRGSTR